MGRTHRHDKEWRPKLAKKKEKFKPQMDSVEWTRADPLLYEEDEEDEYEEKYFQRSKDTRRL
jgi:hypothetical protein